jgi:diacylglycerol O-acyltransferase / wax synthase
VKQLSGLDASFLYLETPHSFGHVSSLSVYSRPDDPGFNPFEAFRARLESRLGQLEPFRRRLVNVPLGIDHPYWIDDPDFDLDFHLRHQAIPPPGDLDQLGDQVARIIGRPMDRTRPLWEVYVIEGLPNGDFAVLTKLHHATIDGASGVELLGILLDTQPTDEEPSVPDTWRGEREPSQGEILARTAIQLARRPERAVRVGLGMVRKFGEITRNKGVVQFAQAARRSLPAIRPENDPDVAPALPARPAPATPFNKAITAHRRVVFRSVPLALVKDLKGALGATVNDVVMAACAGALRRYLEGHDALPDQPLIAMIPISIRTGAESDPWTNRVSGLVAPLPTTLDDPIRRVEAVHESMAQAKERFELIPADVLVEISQFAPPALSTRAIRMAAGMRIADRLNPPVNLVISNVPGPRQPLYLGHARLEHFFPVSTVVDGQGLNITVQSYLDTLDFGLVACRELVPDLVELTEMCVEELHIMAKAAGVKPAGAVAAKRQRKRA